MRPFAALFSVALAVSALLVPAQVLGYACNPAGTLSSYGRANITATGTNVYDGLYANLDQSAVPPNMVNGQPATVVVQLLPSAGITGKAYLKFYFSPTSGRIYQYDAAVVNTNGIANGGLYGAIDHLSGGISNNVQIVETVINGNWPRYVIFLNGTPVRDLADPTYPIPKRAWVEGTTTFGQQFFGSTSLRAAFNAMQYRRNGVWFNWPANPVVGVNGYAVLGVGPQLVQLWDSRC